MQTFDFLWRFCRRWHLSPATLNVIVMASISLSLSGTSLALQTDQLQDISETPLPINCEGSIKWGGHRTSSFPPFKSELPYRPSLGRLCCGTPVGGPLPTRSRLKPHQNQHLGRQSAVVGDCDNPPPRPIPTAVSESKYWQPFHVPFHGVLRQRLKYSLSSWHCLGLLQYPDRIVSMEMLWLSVSDKGHQHTHTHTHACTHTTTQTHTNNTNTHNMRWKSQKKKNSLHFKCFFPPSFYVLLC